MHKVPNAQNIQSMQNYQNMQNIQNFQNFQTTNVQNIQNFNAMQNYQNIQNVQYVQSLQNIPNMQNIQILQIENFFTCENCGSGFETMDGFLQHKMIENCSQLGPEGGLELEFNNQQMAMYDHSNYVDESNYENQEGVGAGAQEGGNEMDIKYEAITYKSIRVGDVEIITIDEDAPTGEGVEIKEEQIPYQSMPMGDECEVITLDDD